MILRYKQFLDWLSDQERGTFCNRNTGYVRQWDKYAMMADRVDPSEASTQAALLEVLSPDRLAELVAFKTTPILSFDEFFALFTAAEQQAIYASADTAVRQFLGRASGAAKGLDLSDQRVKAGLAYLVSKNLITADRRTAILANQAIAP